MEVLLTSTDNPYIIKVGGKHIHLLNLEAGLKALGINITKLYYDKTKTGERLRRVVLLSKPVIARKQEKIKNMVEYLKDKQPDKRFDLIHAHDVLSLDALSTRREKKVLTLHGYFAKENIEYLKEGKDKEALYHFYMDYETRGVHVAEHIITVDTRLKDYVVKEHGIPTERVTVLYNAIDVQKFNPVQRREVERLRKMMGWDVDKKLILVPRRLVEKNGVIYAVQAMKYLGDDFLMLIAGDGPEKINVKREVAGDPRIVILGDVKHDSMIPYFQAVDLILIPSITSHGIQEATSLSMLEGMACGKPTVCSDIGGMKEVIRDGENGFLVKEGDPISIASTIDRVLSDEQLLDKIGNSARNYVLERHSHLRYAETVLGIYNRVIGGTQ